MIWPASGKSTSFLYNLVLFQSFHLCFHIFDSASPDFSVIPHFSIVTLPVCDTACLRPVRRFLLFIWALIALIILCLHCILYCYKSIQPFLLLPLHCNIYSGISLHIYTPFSMSFNALVYLPSQHLPVNLVSSQIFWVWILLFPVIHLQHTVAVTSCQKTATTVRNRLISTSHQDLGLFVQALQCKGCGQTQRQAGVATAAYVTQSISFRKNCHLLPSHASTTSTSINQGQYCLPENILLYSRGHFPFNSP